MRPSNTPLKPCVSAFDYLQKPFEPGQLLETVNKLVAQRRQLEKAARANFAFNSTAKASALSPRAKPCTTFFAWWKKLLPLTARF
jgi:DNA-binding NtrC family response regulator